MLWFNAAIFPAESIETVPLTGPYFEQVLRVFNLFCSMGRKRGTKDREYDQ